MNSKEDSCDQCGAGVPNGEGYYPDAVTDERICRLCFDEARLVHTAQWND